MVRHRLVKDRRSASVKNPCTVKTSGAKKILFMFHLTQFQVLSLLAPRHTKVKSNECGAIRQEGAGSSA